MLSEAGRRTFAVVAGVPSGVSAASCEGMFTFYASPALKGLTAWAKRRPLKLAAEPGVSSYLGDWNAIVTRRLATTADGR
jgi:hypothetical protein